MTNESLGGDEIGELRSEINNLRADVERLKAQARAEEIVLGSSAPALPAPRPRLTILKGGLLAAAIMAGFGWLREHQVSGLAMVAATAAAGLLVVWWPADDAPRAGPDPPTVQTPSRPTVRPTPAASAEPSLLAQVTAPSRAEPTGGSVPSAEPTSLIPTAPPPEPNPPPPEPTSPEPTEQPEPTEPPEPPPPIEPPPTTPPDASCVVLVRVDEVADVCVLPGEAKPSSAPRGAHLTHGMGGETPERQVPRSLPRRPRQEALRWSDVRPQGPRGARRGHR